MSVKKILSKVSEQRQKRLAKYCGMSSLEALKESIQVGKPRESVEFYQSKLRELEDYITHLEYHSKSSSLNSTQKQLVGKLIRCENRLSGRYGYYDDGILSERDFLMRELGF